MNDSENGARALVTELEELLTVTRMGDGWYLGKRKPGGVGRVFGGQVIAQALGGRTGHGVPERIARRIRSTPISCALAIRRL